KSTSWETTDGEIRGSGNIRRSGGEHFSARHTEGSAATLYTSAISNEGTGNSIKLFRRIHIFSENDKHVLLALKRTMAEAITLSFSDNAGYIYMIRNSAYFPAIHICRSKIFVKDRIPQ